ncbi:hypothetical protein Tco_0769672 [Tanacetum coccineum]|uniref:Uncharacterized protein n=1 Tax=Tanacetum coccineum TaxID=301880 RepID=A0ABQ4ZBA5_9ASTR
MSSITKPKHPCGVFTRTQTHPVGVKPEPDAPLGGGRGGGWRGAVMVVWVAVMRWRGWSRGGGGDDDDDKMMMMMMVVKVFQSCSQETPRDLTTGDRLSPKVKVFLIPVIGRNKPEIDILSLDDFYNNLKIYEPKVKGTSSSSRKTQNVAFVSSNNTRSTNGADNTAHSAITASTQATIVNSTTIDNLSDAVICAFFASQPNSPQLDNEDLQQIHPDNL